MIVWRRWILTMRKKNSGTTLVELIVTFALIGLFMTAASFMLTSSLRMFTRMQSVSSAVTVSDVLLDKIAGEIAAAKEPDMVGDFDAKHGYFLWMGKEEGSKWITLWNRSSSPMAIYADNDGRLCLKYYETVRGAGSQATIDASNKVPEMNWHFDEGVYMGYRIEELTFTREKPDDYPNVIRIDLSIRNDDTGFLYMATRYAECYNYKFKQEQVKKYLGVRPPNPELSVDEPPNEADDFVIKKEGGSDGGGETNEVNYTVLIYETGTRNELIEPITGMGTAGYSLQVTDSSETIEGVINFAPPYILHYTFNADQSVPYITLGTLEMKNVLYLFYDRNEDELFQGTIPLDLEGWWRDSNTPVNNDNGSQQQTVNPGGIAKWSDSYYYVVIKRISGSGWNTQSPDYFNETYVIKIPDLEILSYEELAPLLRPEQGSEFHARVFSYKGNYYVRLGYNSPLGSPEEQASEWYELP